MISHIALSQDMTFSKSIILKTCMQIFERNRLITIGAVCDILRMRFGG